MATSDELYNGIRSDSYAVILTADIERTKQLDLHGEKQNVIVLNGHNLTFNGNIHGLGAQRTAKHIIGEGKLTLTNPDGKVNNYYVFNCKSHSYNGNRNKVTVGADVTIDAPNYMLIHDEDGAWTAGYPWVRVYGKINVHSLGRVNNGNRSPRFDFFEGCEVTINGPQLFYDFVNKLLNAQKLQLTINGGTFNLPENAVNASFWTNDIYDENVHSAQINALTEANRDAIIINGGTFNVKIPDIALGVEGKALKLDEATGVYNIVDAVCTGDNHNYVIAEAYNGIARDCTKMGIYYYRCECGAYYTKTENALGHDHSIITIEKEATINENGIKKVTCAREGCGDNYTFEYALSPLEISITLTVISDGVEKEVTYLAKDIFNLTVNESAAGFTCVVNDVIYSKNDIVKLVIPSGVTALGANAISSMESLKEIVFMDRTSIVFQKNTIKDCPLLEKITFGSSTLEFVAGSNENTEAGVFANCPSLTTLDLTKASATFNKYAFASNKTIKHLILGEGNTYIFREDSFRHSSLTEVIIPDNAPTTLDKKCFAETLSIEYIYIGANSIANKKIGDDNTHTSVFGGNSYLSKVVLMDIEYISKWVFSTKAPGALYGPLCDLVVYSHSENLTFNSAAFNDRKGDYTVYLYTAKADHTQVMDSCNYVIIKGLGHEYAVGTITPSTCVTPGVGGYTTDCPCGIDYRTNTYTSMSNCKDNYKDKTFDAYGTETFALELSKEHTLSDITKSVAYANGFMNLGTRTFKCLYCNEASGVEETPSFPALFSFNGYSTPEDGDLAITVGYTIFQDAVKEYEAIMGNLEFGVVGAIYEKLGGLAPLAQSAAPVIKAQITEEYSSFDFVISGFTVEQMDLALVMCAYVYDGTKYVYLQEVQTENPTSVSINTILNA